MCCRIQKSIFLCIIYQAEGASVIYYVATAEVRKVEDGSTVGGDESKDETACSFHLLIHLRG